MRSTVSGRTFSRRSIILKNRFPDLKGKVTDLLIGDLFTEKVDVVWEPMESLYPPGRRPPRSLNSGTPPEVAESKANELLLPDGPRP